MSEWTQLDEHRENHDAPYPDCIFCLEEAEERRELERDARREENDANAYDKETDR